MLLIVPTFFTLRSELAPPSVMPAPQAPSEAVFPNLDSVNMRYGIGLPISFDADPRTGEQLIGTSIGILDGPTTATPVIAVALSPDNDDYAFALPNAVIVYSADVDRFTAFEGLEQTVVTIDWRPGLSQLSVAFVNGEVATIDVTSNVQVGYVWAEAPVLDFDWAPDGSLMAVSTAEGENSRVLLWDDISGTPTQTLRGHSGVIRHVAFSPDSQQLASGSDDTSVIVWDLATGDINSRFDEHLLYLTDLEFSPDGTQVASASFDGVMHRWDAATGESITSHTYVNLGLLTVDWIANDAATIIRSDNQINTISFDPTEQTSSVGPIIGWVETVAVSGAQIALGGLDGSVRMLRMGQQSIEEELRILGAHQASVEGLEFDPITDELVSVSGLSNGSDYALNVWQPDGASDEPIRVLEGLHAIDFATQTGAFATSDGTSIQFYEAEGEQPAINLSGHTALVLEVALTANGDRLASVAQDGSLRIWDVNQARQIAEIRAFEGSFPKSVDIDQSDTLIATGTLGRVDIWALDDGSSVKQLPLEPSVFATDVAFNGGYIAASTDDGRVLVWETDGYELVTQFKGHAAGVNSIGWLDDRRIVSGSADGTIIVWELEN